MTIARFDSQSSLTTCSSLVQARRRCRDRRHASAAVLHDQWEGWLERRGSASAQPLNEHDEARNGSLRTRRDRRSKGRRTRLRDPRACRRRGSARVACGWDWRRSSLASPWFELRVELRPVHEEQIGQSRGWGRRRERATNLEVLAIVRPSGMLRGRVGGTSSRLSRYIVENRASGGWRSILRRSDRRARERHSPGVLGLVDGLRVERLRRSLLSPNAVPERLKARISAVSDLLVQLLEHAKRVGVHASEVFLLVL